ncbi:TreTu family toxin [Dyella jiangningensis]
MGGWRVNGHGGCWRICRRIFNELRVENELVEETVRVGRWMSDTELGEMQDTGMVVESSLNGVTSVTSPHDAMAWMAQTEGQFRGI